MVRVESIGFSFPGLPGIGVAFSTRQGGVSLPPYDGANMSFDVGDDPEAVRTNRRAFMEGLGFPEWCECRQVHGEELVFDPEPLGPDVSGQVEADGMATDTKGLGLVIKTADCQPILLAHRRGGHIMALHAGWRGNEMDYPVSATERFCDRYGLDPDDLFAVRGPSLGPKSAQFVNFSTDFRPGFESYYDATAQTVDLWQLTVDQLMRAGLRRDRIFSIDHDTLAMEDRYFSYRRGPNSGRMASVIWMK